MFSFKELKYLPKCKTQRNNIFHLALQSSDAIMSIRHFLSPILRRFRSGGGGGGGGGEMESGNENGCDDNDIFDVLDDKENQQRGRRRITVTAELREKERCVDVWLEVSHFKFWIRFSSATRPAQRRLAEQDRLETPFADDRVEIPFAPRGE